MDISKVNRVYFLGIGGIGMSALARYFLAQGSTIYGYDRTQTHLTAQLEKEGMKIHYKEDIHFIPEEIKKLDEHSLVIYTPAIPRDNQEFQFFIDNKNKLYKRSEVLGLISQNYFTIAIAGTHGKTTTSSMVAHVLNECGVKCVAFLGGISLNFNSNLLLNKDADTMVVEADEYDRSFLTLAPNIALITSLDADHLDIYGDKGEMTTAYSAFVHKIKPNGYLITKKSYIPLLNIPPNINASTYSIMDDDADTSATNIHIKEGNYFVDIKSGLTFTKSVKMGLPGIHNVENAVGALAIADKLKMDSEKIKNALESYRGVHRRFEYHVKTNNLVYIDDYAHHPSELKMCIRSVRELYPNKKITGIFQPHLYSRTRDFADEFAESLSLLDELILLEIYPARELPIEGVTSEMIAQKISINNKCVVTKEDLLKHLADRNVEVLLTLGAGDIDVFIQPIKALLTNKWTKVNE